MSAISYSLDLICSNSPIPTYSLIRACFHLFRSPPFPHPRSSTFAPGRFPPRKANLPIKTDLIQLLNFFKPMIGDSSRCSTPTSGRELSVLLAESKKFNVKTYNDLRRVRRCRCTFHRRLCVASHHARVPIRVRKDA